MKNPLALAVLEFLTLGLGTLLLGRRRGYGLSMLAGAGLLRFEELRIAPLMSGVFSPHWVVMFVGLTLMGAMMAREVYVEAKARP